MNGNIAHEMVYVPGSGEIPAFWISRYEVSMLAYTACIEHHQCDPVVPQWDDMTYPAVNIAPRYAEAFCRWALGDQSARLPNPSEWLYAASGPDRTLYPWGNDLLRADEAAVHRDNAETYNSYNSPVPANLWISADPENWSGLLHIGGNVQELAGEWGEYRGYGGDYMTAPENIIAAEPANRVFDDNTGSPMVGFRCVRPIPASP